MRIAVLTTSYPRNQNDEAGIFIQHMVEAQSNAGQSGVVIVPADSSEPLDSNCGNFKIKRYRYGLFAKGALAFGAGIVPNLRSNPLLIFQIPGLLLGMFVALFKVRNQIDFVHANWIPSALVALAAKLILEKPYVITIRGEDYRLLVNPLFSLISRLLLSQASAITSVNKLFIDGIRDKFNISQDKLFYIPNGVSQPKLAASEIKTFAEKNNLDPKWQYLVFVGTVIPRKRLELLIDLLQNLPKYNLLICGRNSDKGYLEKIKELAAQKDLSDRVKFIGPVSPGQIPYYLRLSHAYVTASEFEGRSNSVLEALAAGTPVIASDIAGHREIIQDNFNGFLFDTEQLSKIADRIQELENNLELRNKIIQNGFQSVENLSWDNCAAEYIKVFQAAAN